MPVVAAILCFLVRLLSASFSMASPTFFSKNCFSVLQRMQQKWKRLDQPGLFPLTSSDCIWYVILPQPLCFLSSLTYTSPLCFIFPLTLLRPLLETTQGSTFSMSPLYIASSGKTFLLNCSRRVLGEKRNKEFIWWSVYWIKGYKHRWKLGKSSGASLLICMPCTHLTPATTSFWEPFPPSFSNMWFVQNM